MKSYPWKRNFSDNSGILMLFFLYAIASMFSFLLTTNGWMGLFYIIFGVPFYIGFLFILFITAFFRPLQYKKNMPSITLFVQGFLLLLNFGDCGDAGYGGMNFIQRLAKGHPAGGTCFDIGVFNPIVPFEFVLILIAIYIFCLFYMFFSEGILLFIKNLAPKNIAKTIVRIWRYGP